jgi:hypothetical protein
MINGVIVSDMEYWSLIVAFLSSKERASSSRPHRELVPLWAETGNRAAKWIAQNTLSSTQ